MIYIDLDDTLNRFREHVIANGVPEYTGTWYTSDPAGWTPEQVEIDRATGALMSRSNFWSTIPVAEGAHEIIAAAASRQELRLLTALPPRVDPAIRNGIVMQKKQWAERYLHVPMSSVLTVMRENKAGYATCCGGMVNVLVDDNKTTCNEWTLVGGFAIHHTDWRETVAAIKRALI